MTILGNGKLDFCLTDIKKRLKYNQDDLFIHDGIIKSIAKLMFKRRLDFDNPKYDS